MYNASLNLGVAIGAIVDGFIVRYKPWRYIYYVAIALIGAVTLMVYFTFPETAYRRTSEPRREAQALNEESETKMGTDINHVESNAPSSRRTVTKKGFRGSFVDGLKLYHGKFTHESLWTLAARPVLLLVLPSVFWATMVMSVTIGFITAITSNVSPAFATAYGFEAWQAGLCFFAGVIGALFGVVLGGHFSDWVADYFTRRNGGIREPEMRLPAIMISVITGPLSLVLYGVGIQNKMHWMVPTLGIGLSK